MPIRTPNMVTNWLPPSRVYDTTSEYPQNRLAPTNKGCDDCADDRKSFFRMDPDSRRNFAGIVSPLLGLGDGTDGQPANVTVVLWSGWGLLSAVSSGASFYHGYMRNRGSVGWAFTWGVLGALFPIITPIVAIAEGYAKPISGMGGRRRKGRR